jgi:hypothetical protein
MASRRGAGAVRGGMIEVYFDMRKTGSVARPPRLDEARRQGQHIRDSKQFSLCEKCAEAGREGVAAA